MNQFHVYCLARSSDVGQLETDLACSLEIASGKVGLTILWEQASAAGGYAGAMKTATAECQSTASTREKMACSVAGANDMRDLDRKSARASASTLTHSLSGDLSAIELQHAAAIRSASKGNRNRDGKTACRSNG